MKRIAAAVTAALLIGGVLGLTVGVLSVSAAGDTTTVEVTNTTVTNATTFNATYNITELDANRSQVVSTDKANNTAEVTVVLGSTTVANTVTWSDGDETATVNVTNSGDYPTSISSETINVTTDQSVTEIVIDGTELYPTTALGIGGGGGSGSKLLIAVALVVVALLLRN